MATRVIVQRICDGCGSEGDEHFTTPVAIIINKAEYEVDVCDLCKAGNSILVNMRSVKSGKARVTKSTKETVIAEALAVPVEEHTQAVIKGYSGRPRTMPCGVGDCTYMGPDLRSVNMHKSKEHGIRGVTKVKTDAA
jgi:hypothetical protein